MGFSFICTCSGSSMWESHWHPTHILPKIKTCSGLVHVLESASQRSPMCLSHPAMVVWLAPMYKDYELQFKSNSSKTLFKVILVHTFLDLLLKSLWPPEEMRLKNSDLNSECLFTPKVKISYAKSFKKFGRIYQRTTWKTQQSKKVLHSKGADAKYWLVFMFLLLFINSVFRLFFLFLNINPTVIDHRNNIYKNSWIGRFPFNEHWLLSIQLEPVFLFDSLGEWVNV